VVAERLAAARRSGHIRVPLGVNIGKGRDTPAEDAAADYRAALAPLWPHADYVTVNVSSPNTPGLRDLQARSPLAHILRAVNFLDEELAARSGERRRPFLVKIAPDLADAQFDAVVELTLELGLEGVVVGNTTTSRAGLRSPAPLLAEAGGVSGAPLRARSTELVARAASAGGDDLVVVGVGGVMSAGDAAEKLDAGARLVQLYTGLVYEGPALPRRIARGLAARGPAAPTH
jgi:dihydroorotate dehydrogenase